MASAPKTALTIVFGVMTFGKAGVEGVRVTELSDANKMLDVFQDHGHDEIDTARSYGGGSTEEFLAAAGWQARHLVMGTKLYPNESTTTGAGLGGQVYSHKPNDVRRGLLDSLHALGTEKVDLWYLHAPDRRTPFEATLREVHALHGEGRFARFGVSNFAAWEVASVCELSAARGWVAPAVYQGIYNALHRAVEPELVPCLRRYGVALYAFQPLAGGFLTGKYARDMRDDDFETGSRFDPKKWQGRLHQGRYMNDAYFDALDIIRPAIARHGLIEAECALRWLAHHSALSREKGDKIIVGASSAKQLEQNLVDLEKGPLPEDVVEALDAAWLRVKGVAPKYFH